MYDELVKSLRKATGWKNAPEHYSLMNDAADAIEELLQTAKHYKGCADDWYKEACDYKAMLPRWIPVTKRLPEKRHCVLIFTKKGGAAEGEYDGDGRTQYRWSAKMGVDVVTHWMPLPEPPKEETE